MERENQLGLSCFFCWDGANFLISQTASSRERRPRFKVLRCAKSKVTSLPPPCEIIKFLGSVNQAEKLLRAARNVLRKNAKENFPRFGHVKAPLLLPFYMTN